LFVRIIFGFGILITFTLSHFFFFFSISTTGKNPQPETERLVQQFGGEVSEGTSPRGRIAINRIGKV
jgi:hypothetical protein